MLDFNLGNETSLGVAIELTERSIPFVFATGYGDSIDLPEAFKGIGVIKKPYNVADLATAISL